MFVHLRNVHDRNPVGASALPFDLQTRPGAGLDQVSAVPKGGAHRGRSGVQRPGLLVSRWAVPRGEDEGSLEGCSDFSDGAARREL